MRDLDPIWADLREPEPGVAGIYFLFAEEFIAYVGMAAEPVVRIAQHRADGVEFTEALVLCVSTYQHRKRWEAALICFLKPLLNETNQRRHLSVEEEINLRHYGFPIPEAA